MLKNTVSAWLSKNIAIEGVFVDSAEQNYITDLRAEFKQLNLPPVAGSYKATIKDRIDLLIVLMSSLRIKFNNTEQGRNALQAYKISKWKDGKKGEEREDNNEWQNDVMDSTEYAITRHMITLLKAGKK